MSIKTLLQNQWKKARAIDPILLVFLILFLNVKLLIKVIAIVLIFMIRPNFKFGFGFQNSRLPIFYLFVIASAIFNFIINGFGDLSYNLVVATGIFFWILCILAVHQVKLSVEKNGIDKLHQTVLVFFVINAVVSLVVYAGIIIETGHVNPYRYQGNFQKYFIGTGDYIKGISLDTSTTNAILNAFAVIYFLVRNKYALAVLCMLTLILTGSNSTNLLLSATLIFLFVFQTNKPQKSMIGIWFAMLIIFLVKISPQNSDYITNAWEKVFNILPQKVATVANIQLTEKPDSVLNEDERREKKAQLYLDSLSKKNQERNNIKIISSVPGGKPKIKPVIPRDSIHTAKFQHKKDTTVVEKQLIALAKNNATIMPLATSKSNAVLLPGKIRAMQQTLNYFKQHPFDIMTGIGIGKFSSKLAFRATGLKISGGYPLRYAYINNAFESNHLDLYTFYFTNKDDLHSIANSPNNTYDQLVSEYGLAGIFSFMIFYIGFFLKKIRYMHYAMPLLLFMCGAFFLEYWFEQLSVVVFFELLMLMNKKEIELKIIDEKN